MNNLEQRIAVLEQKIQDIDAKREALFQELSQIKNQYHQHQKSLIQLPIGATITQQSSSKDKVSNFSLVAGNLQINGLQSMKSGKLSPFL